MTWSNTPSSFFPSFFPAAPFPLISTLPTGPVCAMLGTRSVRTAFAVAVTLEPRDDRVDCALLSLACKSDSCAAAYARFCGVSSGVSYESQVTRLMMAHRDQRSLTKCVDPVLVP